MMYDDMGYSPFGDDSCSALDATDLFCLFYGVHNRYHYQPYSDREDYKKEMGKRVSFILDRVLTNRAENELVRLYYGIGCRRRSFDELFMYYGGKTNTASILRRAMTRLKYSDEIDSLRKYLRR